MRKNYLLDYQKYETKIALPFDMEYGHKKMYVNKKTVTKFRFDNHLKNCKVFI